MSRYRIVTDNHSGYEVQIKVWWWPVWLQISRTGGYGTNTCRTIEDARVLADMHRNGMLHKPPKAGKIVEYIPDPIKE